MLIFSYMFIGDNLKRLRKKAGITQVQLAKTLGIKQQMITDYERNKTNPEVSKLPSIAEALDATIADLFVEETVNDESVKTKIMRKNSREYQAVNIFRKLRPEEQRTLLKQMKALERANGLKMKTGS